MRRSLALAAWITALAVLHDLARLLAVETAGEDIRTVALRVVLRAALIYGATALTVATIVLLARRASRHAPTSRWSRSLSAPPEALAAGALWGLFTCSVVLAWIGERGDPLGRPGAAWLIDVEAAALLSLAAAWGAAALTDLLGRSAAGRRGLVVLGALVLIPSLLSSAVRIGASPARKRMTAPAPSSPDIILILAGALRADALSAYGAPAGSTPASDALAAEGVRFDEAIAASSATAPSVASILTSRLPADHGLTSSLGVLDGSVRTLAEALRDRGYTTAAICGAPFVSRPSGLARGFDRWIETENEEAAAPYDRLLPSRLRAALGREREERPLSSRAIVDEALAYLSGPRSGPRFLLAAFLEPHDPYELPGGGPRSPSPDGASRVIFGSGVLQEILRGEIPFHPPDLSRARELYGTQVAALDREMGRLLARLRDDANAIVVLASSHGEELLEHGSLGHGHALHEELLRVPLILAAPGRIDRGITVRGAVSTIDAAPTVLDLAGLSPEISFRGRSLRSAIAARAAEGPLAAPALSETDVVGWHTTRPSLRSAREGRWKVVLGATDVLALGPWRREIFDLEADPQERSSVTQPPAEALALARLLEERVSAEPPRASRPRVQDPAWRRHVRALGWVE